jgi:molybdopterin converting factor small subunit
MSGDSERTVSAGGQVTVRYWAAARAAAGVESDQVELAGAGTLAEVLEAVRAAHADRPRVAEVVAICSVLVGDRPVGSTPAEQVRLRAGDVVELLPPFAGG